MARVIVGIYIINSSCLKKYKDYLDMPDFIKFLIKKKKELVITLYLKSLIT